MLERLFDLPPAQRTPAAAAALVAPEWSRLVEQEPQLAGLLDRADGAADAWYAEAQGLVDKWFTLEDPRCLEPAEREFYIEADLDGLTLRGYVDRLDVAPDGAVRIVDYKTGRSPNELFERASLFQMRFYALVLWRLRGVVPRMLQLVYLGDGEVIRYQPDEADLLATERNIKALWSAIQRAADTGDWRPRTSRLCDWCDHRDLCPAWGGTPPPLPQDSADRALDPLVTGQAEPADD